MVTLGTANQAAAAPSPELLGRTDNIKDRGHTPFHPTGACAVTVARGPVV